MTSFCNRRLVPGWQRCYRWLSIQLLALAAAAELVQAYDPAWMYLLPETARQYVVPTLVALAMIGRLIKQGDPHAGDHPIKN